MTRYTNAADVLPARLLRALQRYAAGLQLYVPRTDERLPWGARSGARAELSARNEEIRRRHAGGESLEALAGAFHLSPDSIRKILARRQPGKNVSTRSEA